MPRKRERRPAGNRTAIKEQLNSTTNDHDTAARVVTADDILGGSPDHRHATPSADERREAELIAELSERGYTISVRCKICRHPLTNNHSVDRHVGPKCAAKVVD